MQQIYAFTGGDVARKYKRLSPTDLDVLWSRWQKGETSVQISADLGCDRETITWHVERAGGLRPRARRRAARHLTLAEREEISRGLVAGDGVRALARRLDRAPSTISRELARRLGDDVDHPRHRVGAPYG
jgi:DNA-binding MarR family transcriptional regulator